MLAGFLARGAAATGDVPVAELNPTANFVAHWNGTTWSVALSPSLEGKNVSACSGTSINLNELTGVTALSGSDAWASGSKGNVNDMNFHIPYVLYWNGTAWSLVPSPAPGSSGTVPDDSLAGVASPGGGLVFAAGARDIPGQRCLRTLGIKTTSG